jgi:putative sigma-54 modulation protein
MQIEVHGRKLEVTDAIATHAHERFMYALNQYDQHVDHVKVILKDVNGPKGGVCMVCDADIKVKGIADVVVSKQDADLYLAISSAADTAKVAVGRGLSKLKDHR